jgi:hypothetical protein
VEALQAALDLGADINAVDLPAAVEFLAAQRATASATSSHRP